MIKTLFLLLTIVLTSCSTERREFYFGNCLVKIPKGYEEDKYTKFHADFRRYSEDGPSMIVLKRKPIDFEDKLKDKEYELVKFINHQNIKAWVYDFIDAETSFRIIYIEKDNQLLILLGTPISELKLILGNCFDEAFIEELVVNKKGK